MGRRCDYVWDACSEELSVSCCYFYLISVLSLSGTIIVPSECALFDSVFNGHDNYRSVTLVYLSWHRLIATSWRKPRGMAVRAILSLCWPRAPTLNANFKCAICVWFLSICRCFVRHCTELVLKFRCGVSVAVAVVCCCSISILSYTRLDSEFTASFVSLFLFFLSEYIISRLHSAAFFISNIRGVICKQVGEIE